MESMIDDDIVTEEEYEEEETKPQKIFIPFSPTLSYTPIKLLGSGAQGKVYLATEERLIGEEWQEQPQQMALKIVKKTPLNTLSLKLEKAAIERITNLFCQNKTLQQLQETPLLCYTGVTETNDEIMFVSEVMTGDSLDLAQYSPRLMFARLVDLFYDSSRGVALLHSKKILHRDIKPENILYKRMPNDVVYFKLADYGFACSLELDCNSAPLGTVLYMSPRSFYYTRKSPYQIYPWSEKDDVYSLAATWYSLFHGIAVLSDDLEVELKLLSDPNEVRDLYVNNYQKHVVSILEQRRNILIQDLKTVESKNLGEMAITTARVLLVVNDLLFFLLNPFPIASDLDIHNAKGIFTLLTKIDGGEWLYKIPQPNSLSKMTMTEWLKTFFSKK